MNVPFKDRVTMKFIYSFLFFLLIATGLTAQSADGVNCDDLAYERQGKHHNTSGFMESHQETHAAIADTGSDLNHLSTTRSESAFLGIYSNTISREKAKLLGFENPYGSYVTGILQNTAAERAGLQAFDYIYGVDEYRTAEGQSLTTILRRYAPGQSAKLHYVRKGRDRQVQVTFGRREAARRVQIDKCDEPFLGVQSTYTYHEGAGVNVDVIRNSTAQSLGMKDGDVIFSINGYLMIDWEDIATAMDNAKVGETITVKWKREGKEMQASKPVKSYCATKTEQYLAPKDEQPAYTPDWESNPKPQSSVKIGQIKVDIQDISRSEAAEVQRRHQLVLITASTLPVEQLKIQPNDRQDKFVLSFELPSRGSTLVSIYNDSGRNVYEYDKGNFSGRFSDELDLARNGLGTYYLLIKQGDRVNSKRLSLQ